MVGLAPLHVADSPCGYLGKCGAGPNLVALPDGVVVGYCGMAAKASEVVMDFCGVSGSVDGGKSLEALALRKRAEGESEKSNFFEAEILLSQVTTLILLVRVLLWIKINFLFLFSMNECVFIC